MRRTKKHPVVIKFLDHCMQSGGIAKGRALPCEVVGYLVGQDSLSYRLMTWITEDDVTDDNAEGFVILKSAVTKIRRLR